MTIFKKQLKNIENRYFYVERPTILGWLYIGGLAAAIARPFVKILF